MIFYKIPFFVNFVKIKKKYYILLNLIELNIKNWSSYIITYTSLHSFIFFFTDFNFTFTNTKCLTLSRISCQVTGVRIRVKQTKQQKIWILETNFRIYLQQIPSLCQRKALVPLLFNLFDWGKGSRKKSYFF